MTVLANDSPVKVAYDALRSRVASVGRLHRRCVLTEGAGRLVSRVGLGLLILVAADQMLSLPFYVRAAVLPALAALGAWLLWKQVVRPWLASYSLTRSALLIESARPDLRTRVVSALQVYDDLELDSPRFDTAMVRALVVHAQASTAGEDFARVIDRRPARRQAIVGTLTVVLWVAALLQDGSGIWQSLTAMAGAWSQVGDVARKLAGAEIEIEPLSRKAFLVGSDVTLRARQRGFRSDSMECYTRLQGGKSWKKATLKVDADGRAEFAAKSVRGTFEAYFLAGDIQSQTVTVVVTERPRIVKLKVEYELPQYVRRPSVVQDRSDGNLRALYGSNVILTIQANKSLVSATLTARTEDAMPAPQRMAAFGPRGMRLDLGGAYARGVLGLETPPWLASPLPEILCRYRLRLVDEYGYENGDADHAYELVVVKDAAPQVQLVGLPNRSSAQEVHVLESNLPGIGASVKASDDYGVSRVRLRFRVEDLQTGVEKFSAQRVRTFPLPQMDIPQLSMLRLNETAAHVGDRIVVWAEVEDGYDLEKDKGPHKAASPAYRIAVVSQEESFNEVVYRDEWSTQWYDSLKVATLTNREVPPRLSPTSEAAAKVASRLLDAPQSSDDLSGSDRQLMQDYYDSLSEK